MEKDSTIENDKNEELVTDNIVEETPDLQASTETDEQNNALQKAQADLEAAKDKYIRLYSEFENFRRRTAKEKIEMSLSANEQVIKSLLPVVDDFDRAEKALQNKQSQDIEGYILINNKFKKVLDQFGVKVMEIGPGSDFNADLQEAITQIPAPTENLKGKIVDVVEKGYLLNDKVIRFAKVVIGS